MSDQIDKQEQAQKQQSVRTIENAFKARKEKTRKKELQQMQSKAKGLHGSVYVNDIKLPQLKDASGLIKEKVKPEDRPKKEQFKQPVSVNIDKVKDANLLVAAEFAKKRFEGILKFKNELLVTQKKLKDEREKLQDIKFHGHLNEGNSEALSFAKIKDFMHSEKLKLANITKDIVKTYEIVKKLESERAQSMKTRFHNKNHIQEYDQDLQELVEVKNQKVNQLQMGELSSISVPDIHNKVNDMFIWILECIYKEQPTNYWWDNFNEQVFIKDGGQDYKQRLLGFDYTNIEEREGFLTKRLILEKAQILAEFRALGMAENKSFKKHFGIAKSILDIYAKYQKMSSFVKKNADLQKNEEKLKMFMELQQNLLTKLLEGHKAIETALKAFATMSQFIFDTEEKVEDCTLSLKLIKEGKQLDKISKQLAVEEEVQVEYDEVQFSRPLEEGEELKGNERIKANLVGTGKGRNVQVKVQVDKNENQSNERSDCTCRVF